MKKMFQRLMAAFLVTVVSLSMSACTPPTQTTEPTTKPTASASNPATPPSEAPTGEKVKLTYALWDENQFPVYEKIIEAFESENQNIDVELQLTPWSQYWTKLDAALGGGKAADVFWMNTNLPKYVEAGMVEPLDDYIKRDAIDMAAYVPAMVDLYRYNGVQYGMPKGMDIVQVFYNKEIFDRYGVDYPQEGWTWQDMVAIGEALRDGIASANGTEYPLVMELDAQPSFVNFIWQEGGYILSADGKDSGFDMPETVKAYQDILDLMESKVMPEFKVLSDTKGTDLFLSQKAAMLVMGSWKAAQIDDASFASNVAVIPMAKKSANNDSVIAGLSFAVNAHSEHKEEAWTLVKFLSDELSNKMQAEAKIDMPALISAQQYYAPNFKNLDASLFFKVAQTAYPFPSSPTFTDWFGTVADVSAEIFSGAISPQEGCKKIDETMMEYLGK